MPRCYRTIDTRCALERANGCRANGYNPMTGIFRLVYPVCGLFSDFKLFTVNTVTLDLVFAYRLKSCISHVMRDLDRTDSASTQRINYLPGKMQTGSWRCNCPTPGSKECLISFLVRPVDLATS